MNVVNLIILACWIIFLAYWFVASLYVKRNAPEDSSAAQGIAFRFLMVIAILLLFNTQLFRHLRVSNILPPTPLFATISVVFSVLGIALAMWARAHLGRNWGMPMTSKQRAELVVSGPYRWIRNPIYTGVMLALVGSMFISGTEWFVLALFFIIYYVYSAKQEEKILLKEFPDSYRAYRRRTKMLIPFII